VINPVKRKSGRRRGASLIETTIAAVLLATLLVGVAQLVTMASVQQRVQARRQIAALEAANTLDRLTTDQWERLEPQPAAKVALSKRARQSLPQGRLTVEIEAIPGEPAGRLIAVEVTWTGPAGEHVAPLRLVAFRHQATEPRP
jgi:type II secretory pathway pseudopilin PulG